MLVVLVKIVRCGVAGVAAVCERANTHTHTCQKELIFGCVYGFVQITLKSFKKPFTTTNMSNMSSEYATVLAALILIEPFFVI